MQVVVCCGQLPSQTIIIGLLALVGMRLPLDGTLTLEFFAALTLIDTAVTSFMMLAFLSASRERPRDVFFGPRAVGGEVRLGIALIPVVLLGAGILGAGLRALLPGLHNVPVSPFDSFTSSPMRTAAFVIVAIIAGGVREELQRGFLLHRFEQRLGGIWLGQILWSVGFGLGHTIQGWDAAIITGALGFFWGYIYIKRRSVAAAMVSHAGFNATQVILQVAVRPFLPR